MTKDEIVKCVTDYDYFCERFFSLNDFDAEATGQQNYLGDERDLVALLCWKLLFYANKTFLVCCPNGQLASYWCQMVENAIRQLPTELVVHVQFNRQREITTTNQTRMTFEVMSRNTGRGRSVDGAYLIESQLVNNATYKQFWESAVPAFSATKAQVVHYTRGY